MDRIPIFLFIVFFLSIIAFFYYKMIMLSEIPTFRIVFNKGVSRKTAVKLVKSALMLWNRENDLTLDLIECQSKKQPPKFFCYKIVTSAKAPFCYFHLVSNVEDILFIGNPKSSRKGYKNEVEKLKKFANCFENKGKSGNSQY